MIIENPFVDYPDFGHVLDQMAERGLHLYYHRVRAAYKDEGERWREKWEPHIRVYMQKARAWDILCHLFGKSFFSTSKDLKDPKIYPYGHRLREILEKTERAFKAQKDLMELQNRLLLKAKMNYSPEFVGFVEGILTEWKWSKNEAISTPLFEVAPKGTMEQLKEVEEVLRFVEGSIPMGKVDGLPVHSSEVLEYIRLLLRSILGLSADIKNLWSVRDVRKIYDWVDVGRKLRCEGNPRANTPAMRA